MQSQIPSSLLDLYQPVSAWESFYLRTRWRLCPFEIIEAHLPRQGRILDFGCGYGLLSNLLILRGPERQVTGIDLNRGRIAVARRSSKDREHIAFLRGRLERLDLNAFDAVVMTDVLHHIGDDDVQELLGKMASLLVPQGLLAILDVDRTPFWKFCTTYAIDRLLNLRDRLWYRSREEIETILGRFPLAAEKTLSLHKGLPLADILYLYRKRPT